MPSGMLAVDARNTFATALFMGAARKTKFGTDEPDVAQDGQPKWSADIAVTYLAEPGRKAASEVISVSMLGADPSANIPAGSPVEFDGLKCGVSAATRNDRGGVSGGRLFYMAAGLRVSHGATGRQPAKQETAA